MSKNLAPVVSFVILVSMFFSSCAQQNGAAQKTVAVTRGTLSTSITTSDGNLEMPNVAYLKFGTPGMVRGIYVSKGDNVKAGALLCKLDDTKHLLAIEAAQYSLEIAINSVVQTCCGARYPTFYTMATGLLRFEQAQAEVIQAKEQLQQKQYVQAASSLSLAIYDLNAVHSIYANPRLDTLDTQYNELNQPAPAVYDYSQVLSALETQVAALEAEQKLIENGDYPSAIIEIDILVISMDEAHGTVKNNSRLPGAFTYPDTSTALAISRQVLDSLADIQSTLEQGKYDPVETAQKVQMAQHDLLMSNKVLNEKETVYRAGLSPQTLRTYNLNIDNAIVNLEKAKQDLLDTEIYAPFDGVVVDVPVKINDRLSAFDYASKTAVLLVDTKSIRITGTIDELDIRRVKVKQPATVSVDAFPERKLAGHVTFISPFAAITKDIVKYPVEIYLDAGEDYSELRSGLSATAEIITGQRENVLYVPNSAVKGLPGDYYVELFDQATSKSVKGPVTIGLQTSQSTEITSGLSEGAKVLTDIIK